MLTVHVPFQVTRLRNWFLTDLTLEWLCSSVSELMCLCTCWLKDLPHFPHLKGLSPLWILEVMLTDKWFVAYFTLVWLSSSVHELMFFERSTLNDLVHCPHLKGLSVEAQLCDFSPLWVSMCPSRWPFRPNDLSHMVHLCGFSLVWVRMCIVRFPF